MTAKQEVRSLLEKLPDNCSIEDIQYHLYVLEKVRSGIEDARENGTIEDIQYHLYVLEKVRSGIEDARENGTISQEEAESRLGKWLAAC